MKDNNSFMTPFHGVLFFIVMIPYYAIRFGEYFFAVATIHFLVSLVLGYSYYKKASIKNETTVMSEFKKDLPSFAMPDFNLFHIFMMLLLFSPFWIWIFL